MFNSANLFNKPATNTSGSNVQPTNPTLNLNTSTALGQQTTSLFGQPQQSQQSQQLQPQLQQQQLQQPQTQTVQSEVKPQTVEKTIKKEEPPASLRQILERSKLTNHKLKESSLPTIERGLNQIESQSKKLSCKTASNEENVDIRAHYFLAQGGINTQVLVKELGTIHLGGLGEYRQPIQDTNIEDYITQQNTETVLTLIQDGRQEIVNGTENAFKDDVDSYWSSFLENELKLNTYSSESLNLSRSKYDPNRILSAGI